MELTQEQIEAARAQGCAFIPAPAGEVARLSMQWRLFTLDGQPFVATRDGGGFLETHATLARLIGGGTSGAGHGPRETVPQAEAADAASAHEIAQEHRSVGGGAQEVRRPGAVAARRWQNRRPRGT